LGDWFLSRTYFLTSKASPNDLGIIIIVVIVIGEAQFSLHGDGIIAQTYQCRKIYFEMSALKGCRWIFNHGATPTLVRLKPHGARAAACSVPGSPAGWPGGGESAFSRLS
jgi:hypothetical protein